MRVGITLPQFSDRAAAAIAAARRAEQLGLDGVFCFDHLWPIGHPGRPALSPGPLLGALAASTSSLTLGTLVARVGLVGDDLLVSQLSGLSAISGGRFIAGIGTGDALSRPENEAYGIPFEPADERRRRVAAVGSALQALGVPVWVGGGHPKTIELARDLGAAVNMWEGAPRQMAGLTSSGLEVTWGGPVGATPATVAAQLTEVAAAGATWAVCAWPESLEAVADAAEMIRSAPLAGGPAPPA
jgi:alkanesulfonate monooxygenase SsuD/methylene tetrahydromethanopterin reductase-like flavin-dependent oxidoreductase (luciferase family)